MVKPLGRPCTYTPELADEICKRLALGESLAAICESDHIPPRTTINDWVIQDYQGFSVRYTRARDIGLDVMNDGLLSLADTAMPTVPLTGAVDSGAVNHRRLQVDTRKWYLSKLAPKRYGDRSAVEITGADGGPLLIDDTARAGKLASILAVAQLRRDADEANSDLG